MTLSKITNVSPGWWSAIAGAAAAGAMLMPGRRILAGAVLGGAMLALAVHKVAPCGCTDSKVAQPAIFPVY